MAQAVFHTETGKEIKYLEEITNGTYKDLWNKSAANGFGQLAQVVADRLKGTDTLFFIDPSKIMDGKMPTYARFVIDIRTNKEKKSWISMIIGGNMIKVQIHCLNPHSRSNCS